MRDAVIFDMDGLLLDTERIAFETFKATCRAFDIFCDESVYNRCVGTTSKIAHQILIDGIPSFPIDEFLPHWQSIYHIEAIEKPVLVKPGVKDFLTWLSNSNIPCAVATSTHHALAQQKLLNADLLQYFSYLVTGDQVTNSKPHPEIYLKAAEKLKTSPEKCMALEDSDNGVRSANAANILVFQIPDRIPPSAEVLTLGHQVFPSISDVHKLMLNYPF